ncbi:titin2 [Bombyx mori]|uniref:Hemolin n=1 Tax=Bombyx mori TaxID=7091 RepID=Q8MMJ9_BOMMO|nr:titin2 [Bombyx mori]BAC10620.1 Titin-like protein [Bombyx mori]
MPDEFLHIPKMATHLIIEDVTELTETLNEVLQESARKVHITEKKPETDDVQTVKSTKRLIKKKKGLNEEVTEITTVQKDDETPIKTITVIEEITPEESKPKEVIELPEEVTVEDSKTQEGKPKQKKITKRTIKKRVGPKVETTQITTEQEDDKEPIVSIQTTEELIDDSTTPLSDIEPDTAQVVEETPETVQITQVKTETGADQTVKTTKRVIKKRKGSKNEVTEITTVQKDDDTPLTTVTVVEETTPEESKPEEIMELPEEVTVEETKTKEGKLKQKKIIKRIIKKRVGPKVETTQITTEQEDDKQPVVSIQTTEELVDDTTTPLSDITPDTAQVVEETPEKVHITQVKTETGDVQTVKTTKRIIKKRKGPKEEVTEITTVQKDDEAPVTSVTVVEETTPEESKPEEVIELPEEVTVEETETPEGKPKQKKITKRIIKKRVGPKIETTQITTEQEDDKQPVVSIQTTEELVDDTTTPLSDITPDTAQVVEETPEKVHITQVKTETGDVQTVKTTKRIIKKRKGPKEEVTEITTVQKDDEAPVTSVTVVEETTPEESKPEEVIELPEEVTVEETETQEGKPKQKKITKRIIKKRVGPKIETTQITTEQEDDKQPVVSVQTTEELIDDTTTPLSDITPDTAQVVEETPEKVHITQVKTETGDVQTVKTTKRVIKKKKGTERGSHRNHYSPKRRRGPDYNDYCGRRNYPEESKPEEVVELPEEVTVEETETQEGKPKQKKITKRTIKKRVGPKIETTQITTEQEDDKQPVVSVQTTEELIDDTTTPLSDITPDTAQVVEEVPEKVHITQVKTEKIDLSTARHKPPQLLATEHDPRFLPSSSYQPPSQIITPLSLRASCTAFSNSRSPFKNALTPMAIGCPANMASPLPPQLTNLLCYVYSSLSDFKLVDQPNREYLRFRSVFHDRPNALIEDCRLWTLWNRQRKYSTILESIFIISFADAEFKPITEVMKPKSNEKEVLSDSSEDKIIPPEEQKSEPKLLLNNKKSKDKPILRKLQIEELESSKPQHPEEMTVPQFSKLKLKKSSVLPKQEPAVVKLPKFQLKSRIKFIRDWPPQEMKPIVTYLGSIKQNGELSRNVKEANKIKKKKLKLPKIPDLERVTLEKSDLFDSQEDESKPDVSQPPQNIIEEAKSEPKLIEESEQPIAKTSEIDNEVPEKINVPDDKETSQTPTSFNKRSKLTPIKIERKEMEVSTPQHAETVDGPQFTLPKLKKTAVKPKKETSLVKLPKFQLKSRIKYITSWPPESIKPLISYMGSIKQNGILSRNIKEAAKVKKQVFVPPKLPDVEKTELEQPLFSYEDIVESKKDENEIIQEKQTLEELPKEDVPEQYTITPRKSSAQKIDEIVDEVTIKKRLKPVRKSSVTLPEITEPEVVTFRPKITKTKEDVEQEFNIQLDSYAEEEISMSSKVKLKPQKQLTFKEEDAETSIQFYEKGQDESSEIIEIVDSDVEKEESESANIMIPLKKKLETKNKMSIIEAADETLLQIHKEIDDESQPEEIIMSDGDTEENIEMIIKRKPKKPTYEISEVEELSVEFKPKQMKDENNEGELTISTKRKPKSLIIQGIYFTIALDHAFKFKIMNPDYANNIYKCLYSGRRFFNILTIYLCNDRMMLLFTLMIISDTPVEVRCGDTVFAVYSYVAETDEAINLVEGERLYILDTSNQDWWYVQKHLTEEKGWVPAQYLMDENNYTQYLQKKLNEKIDKLPVFEKPTSEEQSMAPIFVEKLRPKHTPDGSTVQFECQVEGYPRPQITWFRQTAIIKPSQDFQMYYDDDNVATLVIREVFPEDAGTFTCVAKNAAGFASSTTELIVEAPLSDHGSEMTVLSRKSLSRESSLADILEGIPPTFSKKPKAQYVDEGSDILLECRLVAIPEPDIAWLFKGEEIVPDENISVAIESDMHMYCSVLKITNVKKFQEGTYTVVAVNREGEASLPIVLKIKTGEKEPPQVIEPLKSMIVRQGESVILSAQVVGNPRPTITWCKNNKPVKALPTKSDGDTHSITILKPKKVKDEGVYTLKAENSEGIAETSAVITVEEPTEENAEPPLFINRFQEITVKEKGTIKLVARVTGNPVPSITWYRNNEIISPSETITQNFDGENIELVITNVDSEIDSGDYKCVASNSAGKSSHGARVTIDVEKVTFVKHLQKSYETEEGKTVILECQTSHTVSTKWYHNKKEISGMDHREIIQEGRIHKLKIKKTKLTDVGVIKCIVKDQETSTMLVVKETIPEFIRKLQDFEVKEKDVAILEVEINSETADVVWERDGEIIKPKKNKYDFEKRGHIRKLYIRNTSVHDEGEYSCILRDESCTAEVTVVELPPEIITRLQNQKVNKGNKATFEIELTKGDALVRWFKDGSEIQFSNHIQLTIDGKKQKLKIYDCDLDDAGEYSCEVGNSKCTAILTVEEPSINFTLRLPEFILVPANTDAYLTVEIPDETLDVTWYKKKSVIEDTEKFTLISDVKKRTLIIRKCTEDDQCEYTCVLLDAKSSTKLKVEVVEFPPKIVDYEREYRIKRGSDVTLLVDYQAFPQPNDEWIVNSKIIKKCKHTKPSIDSKSASLTIKKVENTDAGIYKLRLENNCGHADVEMNVTILDKPSPPGKPNILEIDSSSINICWDEPENTGNSTIIYYVVEYQEIDTTEWISVKNITKTQTSIQNLKTNSSYRFRAYAVNEVDISDASETTEYYKVIKETKIQSPTVEKPLKNITTEPNEDIELTCIFGGVPQPKVTWYRDGKKLKTAKATYENRVATLVVTVTETTIGTYKCIAFNDHGEVETSCVVGIQQKPVITISNEDIKQKHKVGDEWLVTAVIEGIPPPEVIWYKNGNKLENDKEYNITTKEKTSVIRIKELKRSHSSKYTIEASNTAGTSSVEVTLKVYDKPSKPEGPVIMREISRESVTIEWKPPLDDGGLELTKYAIEKHEPDNNRWIKVADVDRDVETYCIQKLNENCEYMFRVIAQNPVGFSEALESEPIVIKTALGLYGIDNESVYITWFPSEKNGGSPIIDYKVEIKQEGKKWKTITTVTETTARIQKLSINTTYQFRIYARNEIGTSLPYTSDDKITIGKTLTPPSQPRNFVVSESTSRSVTLKWTEPESNGGSPITNYIIEFKTVKGKSWTKIVTVGGSVHEHCIENIKEKDEIIFRISAENTVGVSLPTESQSQAYTSQTYLFFCSAVPSPPTAPLEIRMVGSNIVMTSWGTPEWDGGAPLLGYNIAIRDVTKTMWMEVGKVDVNTLKFNIRDLSENHTYMIRIYARNEIGLSEPLESDEPFKVIPGEGTPGEQTEVTEPTSFSTQTTTSWLREHNMDADIRSYARGSLLRRDEYFFRIWHYAKQLFK